ncbi:acyltransferase family protein [Maricaulis sp.]|uniref:acyltransferase family protein n=1 Tax=Maricaulis sp. TaxID=1486257 RepID=UPI003A921A7C
MKYRSDIDGLRALAVTTVILFHLGFEWMPGGFVGVDVFFTISGYLISRNVIEAAPFSFATFYTRRARRLFPAALVVIVATMALCAIIMSPADFARAAISALAALPSASNFVFWLEAGYWDTAAHTKPLLHTWTLAVEEQFYLVWPAVLVLAARIRGKIGRVAIIGALCLAGLAFAEWGARAFPSAAFYLMPFRIVEFAVGAMLAATAPMIGQRLNVWVRQGLFAGGFAAIVYAAITYTDATRFPGLSAMVPCLGALAIIMSGPRSPLGRILDNRVAVYVGKISYSLYLVHWPIISLFWYLHPAGLGMSDQIAILAVTIAASAALHHFVEQPFRRPGKSAMPPLGFATAALASAYAASLAIALLVILRPAPTGQVATEIAGWQAGNQARSQDWRDVCAGGCLTPDPQRLNVLVIGDSHGLDGWNAARAAMPDANVMYAAAPSCQNYTTLAQRYAEQQASGARMLPADAQARCLALVDQTYDEEILQRADVVIFSHFLGRWDAGMLGPSIERVRAVSGARVVVLGNGPAFTAQLPDIIRADHLSPEQGVIPAHYLDPNFAGWSEEARGVTIAHGAEFVDVMAALCPQGLCPAFIDGAPLSYDAHHLSFQAAREMGRRAITVAPSGQG